MPKLDARQARALLKAEAEYSDAKRALELAKERRREVRQRYANRLPLDEWVTAAGHRFKRTMKSTGKRFALGEFLKNHKLYKAMEPFVSQGEYEDLQVKRVAR